jgi:hypothetical protein
LVAQFVTAQIDQATTTSWSTDNDPILKGLVAHGVHGVPLHPFVPFFTGDVG